MGFLRTPVYDTERPAIAVSGDPAVLVFSKTNWYIHKEAIPAATALIRRLGTDAGWTVVITDNAAVHNPEDLARFRVVIWNNVSGDVLTASQRSALQVFVESGGGFVGLHGTGGNLSYQWPWFVQHLIGAQFTGHPILPRFQRATVRFDPIADPIIQGMPPTWTRTDEWYSFADSPRVRGARVLATLDERTYSPRFLWKDLRMGQDHPVMWKQCVGRGRVFYSAMGHTAESYAEPSYATLLERAIRWAADPGASDCAATPK
jgi:uncharacterized protein